MSLLLRSSLKAMTPNTLPNNALQRTEARDARPPAADRER